MNYQQEEIRELNREITDYHEVATPQAIEAAEEKRREAEPELSTLTQPDAFEEFLTGYLADQLEALKDGSRTDPVCDCPRPTCPLKRGELPQMVFDGETLERGARRYEREHIGSATVLNEAREAFAETCGDVKATLRAAVGLIQKTNFDTDEESAEASA